MQTLCSASRLKRVTMLAIVAVAPSIVACSDSTYARDDGLTEPNAPVTTSLSDPARESIFRDTVPTDSIPNPVRLFRLTARVFGPFGPDTTGGGDSSLVPVVGARVSVFRLDFHQGKPIGPGTLVASVLTGFGGRAVFLPALPSATYRVEAGILRNGQIFETQFVLTPPTTELVDLAMILQRRLLGR